MEDNGRFDEPEKWRHPFKTTISTTIDINLWQEAKRELIAWNEALEFGIRFLLADKQGFDYPNCKLMHKMENLSAKLDEKCIECEELREQFKMCQLGKQETPQDEEVFKEVFGSDDTQAD